MAQKRKNTPKKCEKNAKIGYKSLKYGGNGKRWPPIGGAEYCKNGPFKGTMGIWHPRGPRPVGSEGPRPVHRQEGEIVWDSSKNREHFGLEFCRHGVDAQKDRRNHCK